MAECSECNKRLDRIDALQARVYRLEDALTRIAAFKLDDGDHPDDAETCAKIAIAALSNDKREA